MSDLATFGLGAASILSGFLVGMGAPLVTARQQRRGAALDEQRAIANQILSLWDDDEDIVRPMTRKNSPQRRGLLLLGMRLDHPEARNSCRRVVMSADADPFDEEDFLKAWAAMVTTVASVYRGSA